MQLSEYSAKTLAYIGDAVYEIYIREYLVLGNYENVNQLNKKSKKYVSAKAQAYIFAMLCNELNDEEKEVFRRGRNAKTNTLPKNTQLVTYKIATGFEAVIGYVYIKKDNARLEYLIKKSIEIVETNKGEKNYESKEKEV